jgi:mRNA-degrading endonuclease toxin of MazEF toxin-antitoxin module
MRHHHALFHDAELTGVVWRTTWCPWRRRWHRHCPVVNRKRCHRKRRQRDSVATVSQVVTLDKEFLIELAGRLKGRVLSDIDSGLRLVLSL